MYRQFKYVNYHPKDYKYSTQLGVILKREYPGTVKDLDHEGDPINIRPATTWADYYLDENDIGETNADRVKQEFWVRLVLLVYIQSTVTFFLSNYAFPT